MCNTKIKVQELGRMNYRQAWDYQERLVADIIARKRSNREAKRIVPTENYLLWVEHPPVYTLGKNGDINHLLLENASLKEKGIEFFHTNRGGDITFHGPGQIVGYPILDLENFFTDIHRYLRLLEEVVIKTLAEYGLKGARSKGETGVWLDVETPFARKICAMGVRASRWVTMHGFALNVNTDLRYFNNIIPCGIQKDVTSMERELKEKRSLSLVKERLSYHFMELFEAEAM